MMLELLGQAALRTVFLAIVVQGLLVLLRVKGPQLRLVAWTVVLGASLVMPVLQSAAPAALPILPNLAIMASTEPMGAPWPMPVPPSPISAYADNAAAPAAASYWPEAIYLLVAGLLLARLAIGIALSFRLVYTAARVRAAWAAGTHVRVSRDIAAPVTIGSVILLPSTAADWPAPMREAVLAHERAHIARLDFPMLLAAQLNRAVFWFSPLSWWLYCRLAALAELASDDKAMEATGDRPGYAEVLLEMARCSGPLLRGVAMARPSTLKYRIERILADRAPAAAASPRRQAMMALGAASLSMAAAISRPHPGPAPAAVLPLASAPSAEQGPPVLSAAFDPPPADPVVDAALEPLAVPHGEVVLQESLQSLPAAPPADASYVVAVPSAAPSASGPVTRSAPFLPPSREALQLARGVRDSGPTAFPKAKSAKAAGYAPRGNERQAVAGGAGPAGTESVSRMTGPAVAAELPPRRRNNEPVCTGVYIPTPGGPRTDGQAELLQASYFQASDGTPWLKLFFGSRSQARLSGYDVERMSVRTTVVATLSKGMSPISGTAHGAFGTIDYECVRPNARL